MENNKVDFDHFYMNYIDFAKRQSANVDFSFRCRLQCPACARNYGKNLKERINAGSDIPKKTFDMLLTTFSYLHLCGQISDPIYHPKFLDLLQHKYDNYNKKAMNIHTNGSGKKFSFWEKAFSITDKATKWVFALDGYTQEISNLYRVGTDAENVKEVMVLGASKNITIEWQYLVFEHNEHEVEDAIKFALNNNITFLLSRPDRFGPDNKNLKPSTNKEWRNKSYNKTIDMQVYTPISAIRENTIFKKK